MNNKIRVDTEYLQRNILSSLITTNSYLNKAVNTSKEIVVPNNFIYKKNLDEIEFLLERYISVVKDYQELVEKNINDFNNYSNKTLIDIKDITDITIETK